MRRASKWGGGRECSRTNVERPTIPVPFVPWGNTACAGACRLPAVSRRTWAQSPDGSRACEGRSAATIRTTDSAERWRAEMPWQVRGLHERRAPVIEPAEGPLSFCHLPSSLGFACASSRAARGTSSTLSPTRRASRNHAKLRGGAPTSRRPPRRSSLRTPTPPGRRRSSRLARSVSSARRAVCAQAERAERTPPERVPSGSVRFATVGRGPYSFVQRQAEPAGRRMRARPKQVPPPEGRTADVADECRYVGLRTGASPGSARQVFSGDPFLPVQTPRTHPGPSPAISTLETSAPRFAVDRVRAGREPRPAGY